MEDGAFTGSDSFTMDESVGAAVPAATDADGDTLTRFSTLDVLSIKLLNSDVAGDTGLNGSATAGV